MIKESTHAMACRIIRDSEIAKRNLESVTFGLKIELKANWKSTFLKK